MKDKCGSTLWTGTPRSSWWPPLPDKTAEKTWQGFVKNWAQVFGMPEIIVVGPGTEFQGYFAEQTASHGVALLPTDARAPWQNGRTERAGKEWKDSST